MTTQPTAHIWSCPVNAALTLGWLTGGGEMTRIALADHRRTCAACRAARAELDAEEPTIVHPAHDTPDPGPGAN